MSDSHYDSECVICNTTDGKPTAKLGEKGCQSLLSASKNRGDDLSVFPGQLVHQACRRDYCHPRAIQHVSDIPLSTTVRPKTRKSEGSQFSFMSKCLFCGTEAKYVDKKRGQDVFPVRTLDFQKTIRDVCKKRNDEWGEKVFGCLEYAPDLPAVEARYHQSCSTNFMTGYSVPVAYQTIENSSKSSKKNVGRPSKSTVENGFLQVIHYFESSDNEQMTVSDLVQKMMERCGEDAYSCVYMKKKLLDHYGNKIIITEINGKQNVITYRNTACSILHSFFQRHVSSDDTESEKREIIKTAAKLIQNDIRSLEISKSDYPNSNDIMSTETNLEFIPASLQSFLGELIEQAVRKVTAIGQAIIQASRPRGILAPLQIGLGVQMHHHFGSRFLIETLNSLRFCCSYQEVQMFEMSAALSSDKDTYQSKGEHVFQFVADNVDHNTRTLDGHNTFHGMGVIATVTPNIESSRSVPRVKATTEDLKAIGKIPIHYYTQQGNNMDMLVYRHLVDFESYVDPTKKIDFIIEIARPLKSPISGWSGIMQMVQIGPYPGKSTVVFLPMIDMNPSDLSCVYSTLKFVCAESGRIGAKPIITFDQPLYWKALTIVTNEPENSNIESILLRLGGFHAEMSFLGCIGRLIESTGLQETLETAYAPNAVTHMLSGKAIARGIRGHFLIVDALNVLLSEKIFPQRKEISTEEDTSIVHRGPDEVVTVMHKEQEQIEEDMILPKDPVKIVEADNDVYYENGLNEQAHIDCIHELFDEMLACSISLTDLSSNKFLETLEKRVKKVKMEMNKFKTARLWIQYIEMVAILKALIKAERTGDWKLHLKSLQQMLPYFAAAGHNLYLKSSYIYLQHMSSLEEKHPEIYKAFCNGYHVVRRSDRYWAGLSTDLIIEQVLMRSVKSVGGMTRGRGMTEAQRTQWICSMPACADVNNAMQEFTSTVYETSEQHKETHVARRVRDEKDRTTFISYLRERNPFAEEDSLRNIETGVTADANVNVQNANDVGKDILK